MDNPSESIREQSQMPVYAAYTPNLLPSTFYVDTTDTWRAHPSMWANDDVDMEDFTPAFTENPELVKSTAPSVPFNEKEFSAEEGDYMVPSDAHRLNEAAAKIDAMVKSDSGGDMQYPEWWKSKLTVTATEADQLSDFLTYVNSLNNMWEGFEAEYGTDPEFTEEGFPILIEDIAFPGLSYSYYELREGKDGDSSEEVVYILNPFTADRESLEEINAALDTGYLELYKVIPVSELERHSKSYNADYNADYSPGQIMTRKLNLIPPSDLTGGKFLGMGTCSSCNTQDTEIFQGDPYSVCEECYDSLYLQLCNMCNIPTDVHEMYIDEELGTADILICADCIDNYGK